MFQVEQSDYLTIIRLKNPMLCLSSAVFGGGLRLIKNIINCTLSDQFLEFPEEMIDFCKNLAIKHDCCQQSTAVLLTAVPQKYGVWSESGYCFVTAGLGNAVPLLKKKENKVEEKLFCFPGTINTISLIPKALSETALIEAFGLVKISIASIVSQWSFALYGEKNICVGTPTDCSLVICPLSKNQLSFAGLNTEIGEETVKNISEALFSVISKKYPSFYRSNRPI
ncbi:MAG: adenosylcobinamide amidohydrolase [Candidatus Pacebacteria bacterium]|nr:adenosylcobinamide amidohydrolase [Candidatus Paceibacterota bacterium]